MLAKPPATLAATATAFATTTIALAAASVAVATAPPACAGHMLRPNSHDMRGFEKPARVSQSLD